jgi:transcriptional regulator with XRE-family HTH domain
MVLAPASTIGPEYAIGMEPKGVRLRHRPAQPATDLMKIFDRVLNPREIRRRLGLNQEQFWTQIGVTQSGGSRYESGREMPKPVRELLRLVHVEQIDLSQVKRVDFEIISYLKSSHPDLYRTLRRAVKGRQPESGAASPEPALDAAGPAEPIDLALPGDVRPGGTHSY